VPARLKTALQWAIIPVVAAGVYFIPGGDNAAHGAEAALSALFGAGFVFAGIRLYRERSLSIYGLGDTRRGLLYGAIAVTVVTVAAQPRMWQTNVGEICWFVLVGMVAYTFVDIARHARRY
jgi:hypothetical protein